MRFTEQNTRGMELCTGFIIVKFYDMYEVLITCVFKLVLNLSYVSIFLTCSGRLFHNTGAAYENDLSPYMILSLFEGHKRRLFARAYRVLSGLYGVNNSTRY